MKVQSVTSNSKPCVTEVRIHEKIQAPFSAGCLIFFQLQCMQNIVCLNG